ncbi:MAG: NAD(P)H-hydrate dehydratase [Candidatus Levybacteria bacterium]|nr:NAD(P)H-hydrate dehydratase [Candidatus Levybacteria bacterium]
MKDFDVSELKKLYFPPPDSHKGQNGKLLLIGGSHLFHAASLWALKVASRIVDMVFYSSVPENNQIVLEAKKEFRDGIVVPRKQLESYIDEADCVLIGPGMVRSEHGMSNIKYPMSNIQEINQIQDEGEQTYYLTKYLLTKYPQKIWVIDGGALQMMEKEWLKDMPEVILTPHHGEFERLFELVPTQENIEKMAREYSAIILCKGEEDIVCLPGEALAAGECVAVKGGNAGMTKGGTGDVLAGLVAALACKNDLYLAAKAGSYINKKAGEALFQRVGYTFNSSDLVNEIPKVMRELLPIT